MTSTSLNISASILAADCARLGEEVKSILDLGASSIHIDVMDRHYVPNLSMGPWVCRALRQFGIQAPMHVHLMVEPPEPLIEDFLDVGVDSLTLHWDSTPHVHRALMQIQAAGLRAGVALNPHQSIDLLDPLLPHISQVLIMSVNPGFCGQRFIPQTLGRVAQLCEKLRTAPRPIEVIVDGGIGLQEAAQLKVSGAQTCVLGSALFQAQDRRAFLDALLGL